MKTITEQIAELGNLIVSTEVRDDGKGYKMFNTGSTECEVSEYLYGLVKVLKPDHILETGTYKGISSSYMALALKENGKGLLDTLEIENQHIEESTILWNKLGVQDFVKCHWGQSLDFKPEFKYDLLFLDSEPHLRFAELVKFYPVLKYGGFIGIHDLPRNYCQGNINPDHPEIQSWPFTNVPDEMKILITNGSLVLFNFPSPRGLAFLYKPKEEDYYGA